MSRSGVVTGTSTSAVGRAGGHQELGAGLEPASVSEVQLQGLFPVGRVRKIRFHHLRHTTASLLLMSGADLAAVQRIMRHQDPAYDDRVLRAPRRRLPHIEEGDGAPSFGSPPADRPTSATQRPRSPDFLAAGGAEEPPLPAEARDAARGSICYPVVPDSPKGPPTPLRRGTLGKVLRGLTVVGARGFEPPASCSQSRRATRLRYAPFRAFEGVGVYAVDGRSAIASPSAWASARNAAAR